MEKIQVSFATPLVVVHECAGDRWRAVFTVQINNLTFRGEHMSSTMQVGTYATVSVQWNDKGGNPVKVDGPTKWESSNPDTCTVTVATGNPSIANLFAPGPIGKVQVHATADADLGEGVRTVTASYDVEVISGEAVSGDIKFAQNTGQGNPAPRPPSRR
jgi:hypothetical protein